MRFVSKVLLFVIVVSMFSSCCKKDTNITFKEDLELLKSVGEIQVLKSGNSLVAVSGKLQARVFTSSSKGMDGLSYGWFRRESIRESLWENNYSSLGGEDRLWFGPQFGKYAIFFEPNSHQISENIKISKDLDIVDFKLIDRQENSVTYGNQMNIKNYQNFIFNLDVKRKVSIFNKSEIERNLKFDIPNEVTSVGFQTENTIKNIGDENWEKEKGLLSIWNLGCMIPSPNSVVVIPVKGELKEVTNYFTPLDSSRIKKSNHTIFYKADADYLNKIGTLPENSLPIFGSYNPELNLLTIVQYSFNPDGVFVNSQKEPQGDPYKGDVINIFNDGVFEDGGPFGPFFELETSSDSRELKKGESQTHIHSTYHFEANEALLSKISIQTLGVTLQEIKTAF